MESWTYANAAARTGATGFVGSDVGRIAYQTDNGEYWRLLSPAPTWQRIPASIMGGTSVGASTFLGNATGASAVPAFIQPSFSNLSGTASTAQGALPVGGIAGQHLIKSSASNYAAGWAAAGVAAAMSAGNPGGTASTSGVMMGLGGSIRYTPSKSGTFWVWWSGLLQSTPASSGGGGQGSLYAGTGTAPTNGTAIGSYPYFGSSYTSVPVQAGTNSYETVGGIIVVAGAIGTSYWLDVSLRNFGPAATMSVSTSYFAVMEV